MSAASTTEEIKTRHRVMDTLAQGEMRPTEIAHITGLGENVVWAVLKRLLQSKVVRKRQGPGKAVYYSLADLAAHEIIQRHAGHEPEGNGWMPQLAVETLLSAFREERPDEARRLILQWYRAGISWQDIYLGSLAPLMHTIGDLWKQGHIGIAEEHYYTGLVERLLHALAFHQRTLTSRDDKPRALLTCAEGNLHAVGIQMVADFLSLDGWFVKNLGGYTPTPAILEEMSRHHYSLAGVSVSADAQIEDAEILVNNLRTVDDPPDVILVGGSAINDNPDAAARICADGTAENARAAAQLAARLLRDKTGIQVGDMH